MKQARISIYNCGLALLPAIVAGALAGYIILLNSVASSGPGLPIDDGYIFMRYAENLAAGSGYSFNPGETSFGCTSFLWPVLVAFFFKLFGTAHSVLLVQALGALFYALAVFLMTLAAGKLAENILTGLAAGLLLAATPLGYMNAVSGMETPLYMLICAGIFFTLAYFGFRPVPLAGLSGLCFLTRPEGLFFSAAIPLSVLIGSVRLKKTDVTVIRKIFLFLILVLVIVAPYLIFIYSHTRGLMPTTYLGKIMAADPDMTKMDLPGKIFWGLLGLVNGWDLLTVHWRLLRIPLALGCACMIVIFIYAVIKRGEKRLNEPVIILMIMFLFLPFSYGYGFRVGPAFGGYYQRYIAAVALALAGLGCLGLDNFWRAAEEQRKRLPGIGLDHPVALGLLILYLLMIGRSQYPQARDVFANEVGINQGVRLAAAQWIRENTPVTARVLVGYTGLGVVGGSCGRYVLDIGALINPDIFDYYKGTKPLTEARWKRIQDYIRDKKIDYYVTFPGLGPDPGETPGFNEVQRISGPPGLDAHYREIRIFKLTGSELNH